MMTCEISQLQNCDLDETDDDTSSDSSSDFDEDDLRLWKEEFKRSGDFDFDFSRVRSTFNFRPVIFNKHNFTDEPDTDGALMERLSKDAIKKRNKEEGASLELVKVVRANFHPGGAYTFYITFEATDDSAHQPQTYQTMIGYLPMDIRIRYVRPKP